MSLEGERMLDIGGGVGLCSLYAAAMGAEEVACLQPEAAGSDPGRMISASQRLRGELAFGHRVNFMPVTFQDFPGGVNPFDLVLLHDSVNHLNEDACTRLRRDERAGQIYRDLFTKIRKLTAPGGTLILADCSRYNLFPLLGLKNPMCPTIEWIKHQPPGVWARLLSECGFRDPRIRWSTFNRLGKIGSICLGNWLGASCLKSHFCMHMKAA